MIIKSTVAILLILAINLNVCAGSNDMQTSIVLKIFINVPDATSKCLVEKLNTNEIRSTSGLILVALGGFDPNSMGYASVDRQKFNSFIQGQLGGAYHSEEDLLSQLLRSRSYYKPSQCADRQYYAIVFKGDVTHCFILPPHDNCFTTTVDEDSYVKALNAYLQWCLEDPGLKGKPLRHCLESL